MRMYGVLGDRSEFHVNFTGASNFFGAAAATPIELLNQRWSAVYTTPQTYKNQLAFLNSTGSYQATDTLAFKGNIYYRGFWQKHVDGNTSDVVQCDPGLFPGFLCFEENDDPLFGLNGQPVPDILNGLTPGSIDRTATAANSYGAHGAGGEHSPVVRPQQSNSWSAPSVDRGRVNFKASSELGTIGPDLFVTGTGVIINQPDGSVAPANVKTSNTYYGFYVTDTIDLTPRLSVTAGGRFNLALIKLEDQLGTALNGSHQFSRFNPVIGATYKITPQIGAYAGYSEANRAPTPAELACADPARPCLLDNFLVGDPPLKQVVARTYEAGLRGTIDAGPKQGPRRLESRRVPYQVRGRHHSCRQPDHRPRLLSECRRHFALGHRGVGLLPVNDRWNVYASYNYLDATFQDTFTLGRPAIRLRWMGSSR